MTTPPDRTRPGDAPPNDYDSPWKEALEHYFEAFLALLAPRVHRGINWVHAPEFLDKELQAIARNANSGRRYADKLVRVQGINSQSALILIHVEVQGGDIGPVALGHLGERMFQYFYRIGDRYIRTEAATSTVLYSLGILTESASGKPFLTFRRQFLDCGVRFRFPIVHLARWRKTWGDLEHHAVHNPFALVVMAQLLAQESRDGPTRLASKTALTRLLYQYNYSRGDVLQVFRLIDWIIALPPELEPAYAQEIDAIQQEMNMAYVTSIERLAERRGKQEGQLQGTASVLQTQIHRKFGNLPLWASKRITQADASTLQRWALNVLNADSIEAVFN